jgi:hypothetical protein
MKSRLLVSLLALAGPLAAAACNDPNQNDFLAPVVADTLTAFALTGTSPSFPAAYFASARAVTRADGNFNFDVAFDIDASNQVKVFPQRLVGVPLSGPKPVGLQRITVPFDSLKRAPASGYVFDSVFVMAPGQGLVMQVQSLADCQLYFSTLHYTKFVIDSVDTARRAVYFRAVHDPNCGYRTLVAGAVPRN